VQGWNRKRVLVTGALGFIGQCLVRHLADAGAHIFAGVAPDEASERVAALPEQVQRLVFDLRDIDAVKSAVAEAAPRVVFHLAAVGATDSGVDPSVALMVNAGGTLHLLEAVREYMAGRENVQRVVLTGTCHSAGH
jgi:nucleoside-diphosphate-sugar epimerase